MNVLVAASSFAPSLSGVEAVAALAQGWARQAPGDTLRHCPLAAGGPGLVEALRHGLGGEESVVAVTGPDGAPVPATILLLDAGTGSGRTVVVESAQACGLHLVPAGRRDPGRMTSAGVGELVRHALELGAERVVVGLGGEAAHDGGAGMLAALAGSSSPRLRGGGEALAQITPDALALLPGLREELDGVEIVAAYDDPCPLLGLAGTSATTAEDKGAGPQQAQRLERCLGDLAHAVRHVLAELVDGAAPSGPAAVAGAGAGGGIGYALAVLGARLEPAAAFVLDLLDVAARIAGSDLVVLGQAVLDWRSLRGSLVTEMCRRAAAQAVPVIVVAGQVQVGRREAQSVGVDAVYALARTAQEAAAVSAGPSQALAERAARVARTWSVPE